jgi:hypothetical protein
LNTLRTWKISSSSRFAGLQQMKAEIQQASGRRAVEYSYGDYRHDVAHMIYHVSIRHEDDKKVSSSDDSGYRSQQSTPNPLLK